MRLSLFACAASVALAGCGGARTSEAPLSSPDSGAIASGADAGPIDAPASGVPSSDASAADADLRPACAPGALARIPDGSQIRGDFAGDSLGVSVSLSISGTVAEIVSYSQQGVPTVLETIPSGATWAGGPWLDGSVVYFAESAASGDTVLYSAPRWGGPRTTLLDLGTSAFLEDLAVDTTDLWISIGSTTGGAGLYRLPKSPASLPAPSYALPSGSVAVDLRIDAAGSSGPSLVWMEEAFPASHEVKVMSSPLGPGSLQPTVLGSFWTSFAGYGFELAGAPYYLASVDPFPPGPVDGGGTPGLYALGLDGGASLIDPNARSPFAIGKLGAYYSSGDGSVLERLAPGGAASAIGTVPGGFLAVFQDPHGDDVLYYTDGFCIYSATLPAP